MSLLPNVTSGGRRARMTLALAVATFILALTPAGAGAMASPLRVPGMWIWYVSKSEGGDLAKIAARARRFQVQTVFIKSGDGTTYWSQFDAAVAPLKQLGLRVCAWQYVYGKDPAGEATVAERAVQAGADCFVIDAEVEYENRYAAAQQYIAALRASVGASYPVGFTSFAYPDFHPRVPYSVFLGPGGANWNLPQMYFKAFNVAIPQVFLHTWSTNQIYQRPIHPLGQTYDGVGARQVIEFRKYARLYRAGSGYSWWDWQETNPAAWRALRRKLRPSRVRAAPAPYPLLKQGQSSDMVRWAKLKLNAAGSALPVSSSFDAVMTAAVRQFQADNGLAATGQVDDATWPRLQAVVLPG